MLAILKLGGSILSNKKIPFSVNWDNLERIGLEVREALNYYREKGEKLKLIIIHGGGSFGHPIAKKYLKEDKFLNMEKGFWEIQRAMRRFHNIILDTLHSYDLPVVSIQPSSFSFFEHGKLMFPTRTIEEFLKRDFIPVVHGDIVLNLDGNYKILSGDHILPYLAKELKADINLHASNVDGVLNSEGKVIEIINKNNIDKILSSLRDAEGIDVTGGMYLKVMETFNLKVRAIIFNGNKRGNIYKALIGEKVGTLIDPQ
ncbi:isopentenyl phosphate kinase [Methanocaldococcus infernus]